MTFSDPLFDAILRGDEPSVASEIERLLTVGFSADDILHKHCIPASQEAKRSFEQGVFYVPELLIALRSYQATLEILRPHLIAQTYQQALSYGEFDISCHL